MWRDSHGSTGLTIWRWLKTKARINFAKTLKYKKLNSAEIRPQPNFQL